MIGFDLKNKIWIYRINNLNYIYTTIINNWTKRGVPCIPYVLTTRSMLTKPLKYDTLTSIASWMNTYKFILGMKCTVGWKKIPMRKLGGGSTLHETSPSKFTLPYIFVPMLTKLSLNTFWYTHMVLSRLCRVHRRIGATIEFRYKKHDVQIYFNTSCSPLEFESRERDITRRKLVHTNRPLQLGHCDSC